MGPHGESAGQGHGACVPEAQGCGSLALPCVGLVDALKERRADGTALTGAFDHTQTTVDLPGPLADLGQVLEAGENRQIGGPVDDGLDAKGPALPQVSPDAG